MDVLSRLSCNNKTLQKYKSIESGIVFIYDKRVNKEVKRACLNLQKWLSKNIYFPVKLCVYIRKSRRVVTANGESVVGRLSVPKNRKNIKNGEIFAEVAIGDYKELLNKEKKPVALAQLLTTIAHEIVHYFQWINNEIIGYLPYFKEKDAEKYSTKLLLEYSKLEKYPFDDLEYHPKKKFPFNIFNKENK